MSTQYATGAAAGDRLQALLQHEQKEADDDKTFGFWLYLMSDAIIFAMLFVTYVILSPNIASGPNAQSLYSLPRAAFETAVLLVSSLTFGMASISVKRRDSSKVLMWLIITGLLGLVFLYLEIGEFMDMISKNAVPQRSAFLSSFFTLVGTHGAHVTAGMVWLIVMAVQVSSRGLTAPVLSRFSRLAVFWHFLDVIWIGIFSIVYLPGVMS